MRDLVITVIVLGSLPLILKRPYIGVLVWSWIGYMNPHRLAYGFAYEFPFAKIIGLVTIAALIFSREEKSVPWTREIALLAIFNVWMTITTIFAMNPDEAWPQWEKVVKIQLMVFITLMLIRDRDKLESLLWVIVLSLGYYGVKGGLFSIVTGGQHLIWGPDGSFIQGNNEIGLALTMAVPLMRYLQLTTKNSHVSKGLVGAQVLMAVAIIATYSRGALLAVSAMLVFLWMKAKNKAALGLVVVLALPILFAFMPDKWFARMETIQTYEQDKSAQGRINAWTFAYNLASDHPLLGGGFEVFAREIFLHTDYAPDPTNFHDAHSIYFEVLGEQGYVGLILFLLIGLLTWNKANRIIRKVAHDPDWEWAKELANMLQVSLIGYAVGGAFLGLGYFDLYYHIVAMMVVLARLVDARVSEPQPTPGLQFGRTSPPPYGFPVESRRS
jgi:probable O-glycosylation ligase (exosortase A-associated)